MNICITGAGGLIGRSLISRLSMLDDVVITGFDRIPKPEGISIPWLKGDLQNPDDCKHLVDGQDVVYHFAHTNSPLTSDRDMAQDAFLNLVPTLNLLKAIEETKRMPHFVYPSSGGAIYGVSKTGKRFREDDHCYPLSSYGIQKLMIEHYIRLAAHRHILTGIVFRISNAYGWLLPPDRPQGFIGTALTRVFTNQPIRLIGNTENVRDYIHIDDILDALLLALSYRHEFEVYNIGTGVGVSVIDVVKLIERILGRSVAQVVESSESANLLPSWSILDPTKAQDQLGWRSKIGLEEGIKKCLIWG